MRSLVAMSMMGLVACSNAQTAPVLESYSAFSKDEGRIWCAYRSAAESQAEVARHRSTESARVTYSANMLLEFTYQIEAESGDWVVVDKYTLTNGGAVLRRANLLAQENLQVIQETFIHGDEVDPFHVVSVSTLDGKMADLPPNTDFPEISVGTNILAIHFIQIVGEMRSRSLERLCK